MAWRGAPGFVPPLRARGPAMPLWGRVRKGVAKTIQKNAPVSSACLLFTSTPTKRWNFPTINIFTNSYLMCSTTQCRKFYTAGNWLLGAHNPSSAKSSFHDMTTPPRINPHSRVLCTRSPLTPIRYAIMRGLHWCARRGAAWRVAHLSDNQDQSLILAGTRHGSRSSQDPSTRSIFAVAYD